MARFSFDEVENYGVGENSYFSLKDDKDTAWIRFLYNDLADIQGVAVHTVKVGDKNVDVECLRAYNEPVENCPFCAEGIKVNAKMYIPVYDIDAKQSKIWTRGKTFFSKLSSLCSRYSPLVSTPFEVERNGKKGDTNTTYELYPGKSDEAIIEDFPEINPEGIAFQVKSYEDMNYYLDNNVFPDKENAPQRRNAPQRAVSARQPNPTRQPAAQAEDRPVRRTARTQQVASDEDIY